MNRNLALIWGIIGVLIVGGLILWIANKEPNSTTFDNSGASSATPGAGENTSEGSSRTPGLATANTKAATFISQSAAVLNADINPNGAQTSYVYEYGSTNSLGSVTSRQLIGSGYTSLAAPLAVTNLSANTTYYYRVVAENQFGKTSGQILSFETTSTPPQAFSEPTAETRSATNITRNSAILNGSVNPKGSATYYWFEYGRSTSLGNVTSVGNAGSGSTAASVPGQISGLEANTTYYYRLNAQNGYGIDNGNIFSFTTENQNPSSPASGELPEATTEAATNINRTVATLRGQVDPNSSATTYYFEYGKSTLLGLFTLVEKTDVKSAGSGTASVPVSAVINNLELDTTYHFRLIAENANGESTGAIHSFTTRE